LGVQWQEAKPGEVGVTITKVTPGLPGDKGGLKAGDRLLKFNGQPVTGDMSLRMAVLLAEPAVIVEVERSDEASPLTLPLQLDGAPIRLGIGWREDAADPGAALLTQVVYGSPAYAAGLRERDRVYAIGGQRFGSSDELLKLATTLPTPLEVLAERAGVLHRFTIELPTASAPPANVD
jgi:S1-C subfamily serine protease